MCACVCVCVCVGHTSSAPIDEGEHKERAASEKDNPGRFNKGGLG